MNEFSRRTFLKRAAQASAAAAVLTLPQDNAFPHGWTVIEETVDEGYYGEIGKAYTRALAQSMVETKELSGVNVLHYGHHERWVTDEALERGQWSRIDYNVMAHSDEDRMTLISWLPGQGLQRSGCGHQS